MKNLTENIEKIENAMQKSRQSLLVERNITEVSRFLANNFVEISLPDDAWTESAYKNLKTDEVIRYCLEANRIKNNYPVSGKLKELITNHYSILNVLLHIHSFLYAAYDITKDKDILMEKSSFEIFVVDFNHVLPIKRAIESSLMGLEMEYIPMLQKIQEITLPHASEIKNASEDNTKIFMTRNQKRENQSPYFGVFTISIPESTKNLNKSSIIEFITSCKNQIEVILADSHKILSEMEDETESDTPYGNLLNQIRGGLVKVMQKQNIRKLRSPKILLKLETAIVTYFVKSVPYKVISRQFVPAGSTIIQRYKSSIQDSEQMEVTTNITESTDSKTLQSLENTLQNELNKSNSESTENESYVDSSRDQSFSINSDTDLGVSNKTGVGNEHIAGNKTSVDISTSLGLSYDTNTSIAEGSNSATLQALETTSNLLDKAITNSVNETNTKRQKYVSSASEITSTKTKEESGETTIMNDSKAGINYEWMDMRDKYVTLFFIQNISVRFSNVLSFKEFEISNLDALKPLLTNDAFNHVKQHIRSSCVLPDILGRFYDMYSDHPIPQFKKDPYVEIADELDEDSPYFELMDVAGEERGIPFKMKIQFHETNGTIGALYMTQDAIDTSQYIENISSITNLKLRVLAQEKLMEYVTDSDSAFKLLVDAHDILNKNVLLNTNLMDKGMISSGIASESFAGTPNLEKKKGISEIIGKKRKNPKL